MSDAFSDTIIAYFGYGSASYPQANSQEVRDPLVRLKVGEILVFADELEPDWDRLDLASAGNWARESFATRFPYLTDEALDALAWSCTYGWK